MWASRSVMLSDVYSHTASGAFWSNHEWLSEIVFYGMYRAGGLPLLTLFSAVLITAGWMFTVRLTEDRAGSGFVLMLVALTSAAGWWEPRPHAFSLLFIPWTVFLLSRGRLHAIPLLFLIWANTHGGVLLGFAVLGSSLAARTLVDPSSFRTGALVLLSAAVAMTLTPLGWEFWIEMPRSLSRISLYTLDEWAPTELSDPTMFAFWGIAGMYLWEVVRRRRALVRVTPSEAAIHASALVLLPAAVMAVRNVGPFLMVGIPALTRLWASEYRARQSFLIGRSPKLGLNVVWMLAAICCVGAPLTVAYRQNWDRLRWAPIPAEAVIALGDCPGNLYNRYDEGGMLLWFAQGRKVFLDGRQDPFPPSLVLEHIEMETGRRRYEPTFERYDIRCAFLPVASPVARQLSRDGWESKYTGDKWMVLRAP
jgi:hypothetical protein